MAQRAPAGALESDTGDKTALGRSGENASHAEGALGLKVLRQERAWRVWGTERVQVWLGRRERGERECRGQCHLIENTEAPKLEKHTQDN